MYAKKAKCVCKVLNLLLTNIGVKNVYKSRGSFK
jgi:hypothetical protein